MQILVGTALKISCENSLLRSSSLLLEPTIILPEDENGEMALLWEPITVQVNSRNGLNPVAADKAGINGNSAGHTTPIVDEKKLIKEAIAAKATGSRIAGTFAPIQEAIKSTVPPIIAT